MAAVARAVFLDEGSLGASPEQWARVGRLLSDPAAVSVALHWLPSSRHVGFVLRLSGRPDLVGDIDPDGGLTTEGGS